jgi:uncharacterized membrane protein
MVRFVIPMLVIAVWVYALVDAIRVPDDSMYQAGNKLIWVVVILLAPLIGALIYLTVGRPIRQRPSPPRRHPWTEDDLP